MSSIGSGPSRPKLPNPTTATHQVTARIVGRDFYLGAKESAVFPRYEVEFSNSEGHPVRISTYKAAWPSNHRQVVLQDFVLAPGERKTTTFVVKPDGKSIAPKIEEITLEWTAEPAR
jgi:hypothetical protein